MDDNLQHRLSSSKNDKHKFWKIFEVALGYNFRLDIIFYNVPIYEYREII